MAGDVENATSGFVAYADLSSAMRVPRADWVFSTEVGEHIPHGREYAFVSNLHAHACRGVVLSWELPSGPRGKITGHGQCELPHAAVHRPPDERAGLRARRRADQRPPWPRAASAHLSRSPPRARAPLAARRLAREHLRVSADHAAGELLKWLSVRAAFLPRAASADLRSADLQV